MKKSTKKTPSPAPATSRASAPKAAPKAKAKAPKAAQAVTRTAPPLPPRALPAGPIAGLVTESATQRLRTVVNATTDVGFGNTLYIRGDGPGLSWDKGVPLECVAGDHWKIELEAAGRPVAFKLLINDEQWNCGPDFTVEAGAVATVDPKF